MPTNNEVREFLETHAPGKPEVRELLNSFFVEWGDDISMSAFFRGNKYVIIRHYMTEQSPDETLYLNTLMFALKVQKFLTTS